MAWITPNKTANSVRASLVVLLLLICGQAIPGRAQEFCTRVKTLLDSINGLHLIPQEINDTFSERVSAAFITLLDPEQNYFTKKDSLWINKFRHAIDDGVNDGGCSFLPELISFYKLKLTAFQHFADSSLKQSPRYSQTQKSSALIASGKNFAADEAALKKKQMAWFKLRILSRAWRISEAKGEKLTAANFLLIEKAAREKILVKTHNSIEHVLKQPEGFNAYVEDLLMKAMCLSYDPHTEYFTSFQMKSFQSGLSNSGLSFGFEIAENETGGIQITNLVPGSPAWKSEAIKKGDLLISITSGNSDPMETSDFELDEIRDHLENMANVEASVIVKSPDGKVKSIKLKKEKIENMENLISSFLLDGKRKIGYIQLPGFYTNENLQAGHGCAGDVAKEILKLKKEGIEALILDLRFNGGGSVQEAIELGGIFIDAGPFAIMEGHDGQLLTLKDFNRGSVYTGPLLVMLNAFSASASELVAAGLQDYYRAIIMGCESYGKATGQIVVPLGRDEKEAFGFVKITNDRIYRVTGRSLQLNGVLPDISVPEITAAFGQKEGKMRYSIEPKSISKKIYFTPLAPLTLSALRSKSEARVASSPYFQSIEKLGLQLAVPIPLEPNAFIGFMSELDAAVQDLSVRTGDADLYKVYVSGFNKALFAVDTYHKEISENALEELKSSPYVREAYAILSDHLQLISKP
jgi:carboxyl-terminal processing protease